MRNPEAMEMPLLNRVPLGNTGVRLAFHAANDSSQQILLFLFEFES